ncbi:MAG TPA: hypothetical protein VGJ32_01700 [Solirubrobacteraceae bacterium]|jgi:hypothetical protein
MAFRSDRDAEKRRAKLADIEQQVADGTLTRRPMTDAERKRFGIGDADRPFRRFFFPGARAGSRRSEDEYQRAARAAREATGSRPSPRRIFRVDCQLEGKPCRLEVGTPEPSGDAVVTAIFELADEGELAVWTADEEVALRVPAAGADVLEFA